MQPEVSMGLELFTTALRSNAMLRTAVSYEVNFSNIKS